jgi:hypothetical protein
VALHVSHWNKEASSVQHNHKGTRHHRHVSDESCYRKRACLHLTKPSLLHRVRDNYFSFILKSAVRYPPLWVTCLASILARLHLLYTFACKWCNMNFEAERRVHVDEVTDLTMIMDSLLLHFQVRCRMREVCALSEKHKYLRSLLLVHNLAHM